MSEVAFRAMAPADLEAVADLTHRADPFGWTLRNFSDAVQNMVQGVRAASISWGDQNYQMLFRSIQGLSTKSKRVLDSGNRAAQAAERFFEISQEQY